MAMNAKTKFYTVLIAKLIGIAACCVMAVALMIIFMWVCYDAGFKM